MEQEQQLQIIARIRTEFPEKFGVPRQSGLVEGLRGCIVFEPPYRNEDALRGLEGFSHIWLLWQFSLNRRGPWSPTVRPPRLGGNARRGVFATRSPNRPNPIGLSSVRLMGVELHSPQGPLLYVAGADLVDGTPIYDIKPYLPFTDSHPEASGGFAAAAFGRLLTVEIPGELAALLPPDRLPVLKQLLAEDPRPAYQEDDLREYGLDFAGFSIRFTVEQQRLTVTQVAAKAETAR